MSYRIACEHSGRIASFMSFAGANYKNGGVCANASPVHVLQVHGTEDKIVEYGGGCWPDEITEGESNCYAGAFESVAEIASNIRLHRVVHKIKQRWKRNATRHGQSETRQQTSKPIQQMPPSTKNQLKGFVLMIENLVPAHPTVPVHCVWHGGHHVTLHFETNNH